MLGKMMAKDPADRYQSYQELKADLKSLLAEGAAQGAHALEHAADGRDRAAVAVPSLGSDLDPSLQDTQIITPRVRARRIGLLGILIGVALAVAALGAALVAAWR